MAPALRVLLLTLLVASPLAAGVPARYLVFEIDRNDAVTLVGAEEVEVAGVARERAVETTAPTLDPRRIDVELRDASGRATYRTSVRVERYVRAEFEDTEPRWIELERAAFVVRIPAGGETIEVTAPRSRTTAQFSVRALPRTTRAAIAPRIRGDAGDPANRLDLLVMGDGYTGADVAKFDADVQRITSQFFGIVPYSSYRRFVNVKSHFVASAQSGADHPECKNDPSAQPDPKAGTTVDTAFDASFCSSGLQRLLTVNPGKVYTAAAAVPDWDMIIVVVNDSMYGGAGGSVSVVSTNAAAVAVAQHELGHSFTELADEYSTPYPSYPPCSDIGGHAPCEANVTDHTARAAIKWNHWIASTTALPTPPAFNGVGLFLGARYHSTGFYRPRADCLMNTLGRPFCEICTQAYVLRLYDGWHGVPAGGIDLIESVSPPTSNVNGTAGQSLVFTASVLHPDAGAARVRWYVDGVEVVGATSERFEYTPSAGTHTIELRVSDPTTLVHPAMAGAALTTSRAWTVSAAAPPPVRKRRAVQ